MSLLRTIYRRIVRQIDEKEEREREKEDNDVDLFSCQGDQNDQKF
jgi:hypothetical protein